MAHVQRYTPMPSLETIKVAAHILDTHLSKIARLLSLEIAERKIDNNGSYQIYSDIEEKFIKS